MDVRKRKGYMSGNQKQRLVEIMAQPEQKCLIIGKFTQKFTKKDSEDMWNRIALSLNAIPGGVKTGADWKRAWSDIKTKTKSKNSMLKKYVNKTGGGPSSSIIMNSVDDQIISLINPTTISGHKNVLESAVEFSFNENIDQIEYDTELNDTELNNDIELHDDTEYQYEDIIICDNVLPNPSTSKYIKSDLEELKLDSKSLFSPKKRVKSKQLKSRTVASVRLEKSVEASQKLVEIGNKKLYLKEEYYKKKLEILEAQTKILERKAISFENIQKDLKEFAARYIIEP